jgi:hypothetical protein
MAASLSEYVKSMLDKGQTSDQVRDALVAQGYDAVEVNNAILTATTSGESTGSGGELLLGLPLKTWIIIGVAALVLLVGSTVYYFSGEEEAEQPEVESESPTLEKVEITAEALPQTLEKAPAGAPSLDA